MGTNYYAIPKANEEIKVKIIKAICDDDWQTAHSLMPVKIHIGKSSGGWQFLFNHNNWEYYTSKTLPEFLANCRLMNEYNEPVNINDFWHLVDRKGNDKPELEYGQLIDGLVYSNYTEFS